MAKYDNAACFICKILPEDNSYLQLLRHRFVSIKLKTFLASFYTTPWHRVFFKQLTF